MSEGLIGLFLLGAAALPLSLFDLAFLPSTSGFLSLAALIGGLALTSRRLVIGPTINLGAITLCIALSALLCLLGGEMHVFSPTSDWTVRDAVLHDLVVAPWPVHYEIDGRDFLLRAPLGIYLVPAALGKIFGLAAAHIVLFLQNTAIFAGLLMLFTARSKTWRERLLILGLFVFFSGLDVLPWAKSQLSGDGPPFDWHLETWVDWLQYSSHITQLFWVPHHALAGWGFIAAYLCWRRGALSAWSLIFVFALCMFWSPLAMIGALPFLCYALFVSLRAGKLQIGDAAGPALITLSSLPAIAYLMMASGTVEKRWLFLDPGYPLRYVEFLTVELVLWFWIFYITPRGEQEAFKPGDLWIAAISLLLFPLYSIGFSNDFTMRASIPALALIALAAVPRVSQMLSVPGARRIALATGLAAAAITPGVEIARALIMPTIPLGNCPLPLAWQTWAERAGNPQAPMSAYLADANANPMASLLATPVRNIMENTPCGSSAKPGDFKSTSN